jgi:hypothetical protein
MDPVAECERGFHCRSNAEMLEETDPATAAKLECVCALAPKLRRGH